MTKDSIAQFWIIAIVAALLAAITILGTFQLAQAQGSVI
jgi:hypothetical protein